MDGREREGEGVSWMGVLITRWDSVDTECSVAAAGFLHIRINAGFTTPNLMEAERERAPC